MGPFEIRSRVGDVAYILTLPTGFSAVHNCFHLSLLKKYIAEPSHMIVHDTLEIKEDAYYTEKLAQIIDTKEQVLRTRTK